MTSVSRSLKKTPTMHCGWVWHRRTVFPAGVGDGVPVFSQEMRNEETCDANSQSEKSWMADCDCFVCKGRRREVTRGRKSVIFKPAESLNRPRVSHLLVSAFPKAAGLSTPPNFLWNGEEPVNMMQIITELLSLLEGRFYAPSKPLVSEKNVKDSLRFLCNQLWLV